MKDIEVAKVYDAYNDGKISPSRLVRVKITDAVRREDLGRHWWKVWKDAVLEDTKRARRASIYKSNGKKDATPWGGCMNCRNLFHENCKYT